MTLAEYQKVGKLPWHIQHMKRNPKCGYIYDAEGRLVVAAAIGNARHIGEVVNKAYQESEGKE